MKQRIKSSYAEQMCKVFHEYVSEFGDEVDLDHLFDWAREHDKWDQPKLTLRMIFKREMSRALRGERFADENGHPIRRNHVFRQKVGEKQTFLWSDILTIEPTPMQKCLQQRRLVIASAAIQHDRDTQYYNNHNGFGAQLVFEYDLNKHVQDARNPTEWPDERPNDESEGEGVPA